MAGKFASIVKMTDAGKATLRASLEDYRRYRYPPGRGGRRRGIGGGEDSFVARVRVTAAASGGGKYTGYTVAAPTSAIAPTGNLADSDLGANTSTACLIVNAAEAGQATHDLTEGTPVQKTFIGYYVGMSDEATPKPAYMINGFDWGDCA